MYTLDELADELNRQEWAVERMLKNRGYLKKNGDPRKSTIDDGLMNKNGLIKEVGWSVFIDELGYKDTEEDENEDEEDIEDEDEEDDDDDDDDDEDEEDDDEDDDDEDEEDDDEEDDEDNDDYYDEEVIEEDDNEEEDDDDSQERRTSTGTIVDVKSGKIIHQAAVPGANGKHYRYDTTMGGYYDGAGHFNWIEYYVDICWTNNETGYFQSQNIRDEIKSETNDARLNQKRLSRFLEINEGKQVDLIWEDHRWQLADLSQLDYDFID